MSSTTVSSRTATLSCVLSAPEPFWQPSTLSLCGIALTRLELVLRLLPPVLLALRVAGAECCVEFSSNLSRAQRKSAHLALKVTRTPADLRGRGVPSRTLSTLSHPHTTGTAEPEGFPGSRGPVSLFIHASHSDGRAPSSA
eukprot:3641066-Prymnesium_polylepis.1